MNSTMQFTFTADKVVDAVLKMMIKIIVRIFGLVNAGILKQKSICYRTIISMYNFLAVSEPQILRGSTEKILIK